MADDFYAYNKKSFQKTAPFYNLISLPFIAVRSKVVLLSGAKEGNIVLDVCTGTGSQAFAFGKLGCDVIGMDLSEDMLKIAEKRNRYNNVKFGIADAARLPFENKQFDFSVISLALHDMPRQARDQTLQEMKRVSRKMIVVDFNASRSRLGRFAQVFFPPRYKSKYYRDFARQDLKELLQRHDLKVIRESYGLVKIIKILVCET
jgi:demethylmenaquinone methyltransferase/2-methoxy-6-polyprenyl-1,4-benzoquinol methylase